MDCGGPLFRPRVGAADEIGLTRRAHDWLVVGCGLSSLNGGGGGSRTRVFLSLRHIFYMLSVIVDLDRVWECAPVRPIFILTYPGDRN